MGGVVVTNTEKVRYRQCTAVPVDGQHKQRKKDHGGDCADPIEVQGRQTIFRTCSYNSDDFQRPAICRQEGNRPSRHDCLRRDPRQNDEHGMTNSFGLGTSTEIFLYESIAAWRVEAWYQFRHTLIFLMLDTAVAGDGLSV